MSVQLKDVKAAVRKTDPGRESAETESEGKEEKTKEITKEKTKKKESADGQEEWKEYELDRLLVYLPPEEIGKEELLPGMKLLCMGELEIFEPARNAGEFDYRLYYRSRHICCRMSAKKAEITDRSADPLKAAAYSFRERAREALKQFCTEKDAGLLSAVLLGDKTQMDEEINDLYQKNGIAHLLAVSGLHVSLIGMGLYRLLRRLGLGFGWAGVWSGGLLFLYGTMTGFGPSVFRACLMLACSFAASYLGRTYDLLSAMSLAAICLSLENPFVIFTGAFQLSFGAVFAIGWAGKELSDGLECKKEWENALSVSLAIQLVTGPIVLYHFFEYPLYGIFLNFLVIPLMTYVVGAGIAGLLMGMAGISLLAAAAGAGTLSGAAAAVGHLLELGAEGSMGTCHYIFAWYEMLCRLTKRLPGSSLILGRPESWKLAAYYGILAVLLLFLGSRGRKRAETGERTKAGEMMEKDREAAAKDRFMDRIKIWGCLSSLIVFLLYRSVSGLRIDFIDVGQGDGILLETKKQVVLVDGGSTQLKKLGEQRLEPLLKSRGIRKIDMAFVSHGDQDHISGLMWLLEEDTGIEIGRLFLPLPGKGEEIY